MNGVLMEVIEVAAPFPTNEELVVILKDRLQALPISHKQVVMQTSYHLSVALGDKYP